MGNKSGGFRKLKKTGGELNLNDIEKINELITDKLVHFGLIPAIEPAAIDTGAKKSSAVSKKVGITDMVFAKSTIPLSSGDGSSDVYFHMVKITEENVEGWESFKRKLDIITPEDVVNINPPKDIRSPSDKLINI